jgi:hypothetical protein
MGFCDETNQEGTYWNRCSGCGKLFIGYKGERYCNPCLRVSLKAIEKTFSWNNNK